MENQKSSLFISLKNLIIHLKNYIALAVLLVVYHWYDALCYAVSNMFDLFSAICIMISILFPCSIFLIWLHEFSSKKYGWDVLELDSLNDLRNQEIPKFKIFKRFLRFIMRRKWTIYWIGSAVLGSPVVALLLRKNNNWSSMIKTYVIPGTLISVLFWVPVMKGLGSLTWEQYVKPFFSHWF